MRGEGWEKDGKGWKEGSAGKGKKNGRVRGEGWKSEGRVRESEERGGDGKVRGEGWANEGRGMG